MSSPLVGQGSTAPDSLRAAIELVLANPEAVAEILSRARPAGVRHDAWTGERMATFLEVLADTGLVTEGYRAAGMSRDSAYALRNRDPVFAAAWAAAQSRARPVVGDGLLERSITGTVEHYYRDGVLVGERRHYESWLGLAVLKRLDKQAEEHRADANLAARITDDWQAAIDALRSGGSAAVTPLLDGKADKADTPPIPFPPGIRHCWKDQDSGAWMTNFPPPGGFEGHESGPWDDLDYYERVCTPEEADLLDAHEAAAETEDLAEAEKLRDDWFAEIRRELGRERR